MQIFLTGASGYVGQVLAEHAIRQGHSVLGLSRSEISTKKLNALRVTPLLGDLLSMDGLAQEIGSCDAAFHLAFVHDWNASYTEILDIDRTAVQSLGNAFKGSQKPLVVTSATPFVEPSPSGEETDEWAPTSDDFVLRDRVKSERAALALQEEGIRVSAIRLPTYVYGRGGSSSVPMLMKLAADLDVSAYIGEGKTYLSAVHVDDAARCYLLAMEKAESGAVFNCTSQTDITFRELAEAIGTAVGVPVKSKSRAEVQQLWGPFLTAFVEHPNRASSARARRDLGWEPKEPLGLLEDIVNGSYRDLAASLRKKEHQTTQARQNE
jgi:nucleoside-diphosphate-sugar epimerase